MGKKFTKEQKFILETFASPSAEEHAEVTTLPPEDNDPVRDSLLNHFESQAVSNLGCLDIFPMEVLLEIVRQMDIQCCFQLRKVNRAARALVSDVKEYRQIVEHAIGFFRMVLQTKPAHQFTLESVMSLLNQSSCHDCENFADFVSLANARKYCYDCLGRQSHPPVKGPSFIYIPELEPSDSSPLRPQEPKDYFPDTAEMVSLSGLAKRLKVKLSVVRKAVPSMVNKFSPASQPFMWKRLKGRLTLVWIQDAVNFARTILPKDEFGEDSDFKWLPPREQYWIFLCATTLPYIEPQSGKVQCGVCCEACEMYRKTSFAIYSSNERKVFTYESFLEHYQECKNLGLLGKGFANGGEMAQ